MVKASWPLRRRTLTQVRTRHTCPGASMCISASSCAKKCVAKVASRCWYSSHHEIATKPGQSSTLMGGECPRWDALHPRSRLKTCFGNCSAFLYPIRQWTTIRMPAKLRLPSAILICTICWIETTLTSLKFVASWTKLLRCSFVSLLVLIFSYENDKLFLISARHHTKPVYSSNELDVLHEKVGLASSFDSSYLFLLAPHYQRKCAPTTHFSSQRIKHSHAGRLRTIYRRTIQEDWCLWPGLPPNLLFLICSTLKDSLSIWTHSRSRKWKTSRITISTNWTREIFCFCAMWLWRPFSTVNRIALCLMN